MVNKYYYRRKYIEEDFEYNNFQIDTVYTNKDESIYAVGVGFIALAGVAVEIGVIMLVYLNQAYQEMLKEHKLKGAQMNGTY